MPKVLGGKPPAPDGPATVWRDWEYGDRLPHTAFIDIATGRGVNGQRQRFTCGTPGQPPTAGQVLEALPEGTRRVFLCGERIGGSADDARAWGLAAALPPGWSPSDTGHYLTDPELPVYRWHRPDPDRPKGVDVDVRRVACWMDGNPTPDQALTAMTTFDYHLRRAVNVRLGDPIISAGKTATWGSPGGLGTHLWRTMITYGHSWPLLSQTHQKLIRKTATQGRVEPSDGPRQPRGPVGEVTVLDRRLAYWAHCKDVAHGPAVLERAKDWPLEDAGYRRARYRIVATVPDGWAHVGLVPERSEDGDTWTYPNQPGQVIGADRTREVWVDGYELMLLRKWGWPFVIAERLLFGDDPRRDPLGPWSKALLRGRTAAATDPDLTPELQELVAGMFRNVILHSIGSFFAGQRRTTRYVPLDQARSVPGRVCPQPVRLPNGQTVLMWTELVEPDEKDLCHPEFAACIWRRNHVCLLDGPGNTGALHVAYNETQAAATGQPLLLGLRTDSVWMAGKPKTPWPDQGRPGQYRPKGRIPGPVHVPERWEDALALLQAA